MRDQELLTFSGVDGVTGEYLLPPIRTGEFSRQLLDRPQPDRQTSRDLEWWHSSYNRVSRGIKDAVDPSRLDETGWGVVFSENITQEVRRALRPLLERRRQQSGQLFQQFDYYPGESKIQFLERHGAGPGPIDPAAMPYYILIVADAPDISFHFQSQLGVQYGVGRVFFDTIEKYEQYASSVLRNETRGLHKQRTMNALIFGTRNPDDLPTRVASDHIISPLAHSLRSRSPALVRELIGGSATKSNLLNALNDRKSGPGILFAACHGLAFPAGDPRQRDQQGGLVCQDWPGPRQWREPLLPEHYIIADDIPDLASLEGLIAFLPTCFSAGTQAFDEIAKSPRRLAKAPFVSRLAQKLLSLPAGGALAIVGNFERAWNYSLNPQFMGMQVAIFESVMERLLGGYPIGFAHEFITRRYAELAVDLFSELDGARHGRRIDAESLARLWLASSDAQNTIIIGDPAVRLATRQ